MSRVKLKKLKNGATIIFKKANGNNCMAVRMGYVVGHRDNNVNGVAHFLEHSLFLGTKNRTREQITDDMQNICFINAGTSSNSTTLMFKRSNKILEKSFELGSDILFNSSFSKQDFQKEKGVIKEEYKISEDKALHDILYQHSQIIYKNPTTKRLALGNQNDIQKLKIEDLENFKNQYYIAKNFVLSVVGKISYSKVKKLYKKYILPNLNMSGEKNTKERYYLINEKESYQVCKNDENKISILISFKINQNYEKARKDYNYFALYSYLNFDKDSFYERLRKEGLVYIADAFVDFTETVDCGMFYFKIITSYEKINRVLEILGESVKQIKNGVITEEKVTPIKNNLFYSKDETEILSEDKRAYKYLYSFIKDGKIEHRTKRQEKKYINAINSKTITQYANDIFNKNNKMYVTIMGNVEKKSLPKFNQIKSLICD